MKMNFRMTLLSMATLGLFSCSDKVDDSTQLPSDGITEGFVTFSVSAVGNELRTARAGGGTPVDGDFDYDYKDAQNEYEVSATTGANVVYFFDQDNKFISQSNLQIMNGTGNDVSHDDHNTGNTIYKEKLLKARIIKEAGTSIATGIIILNGDPNTLSNFTLTPQTSTLSDFMKLSQTLTLTQGKSGNTLGRYGNLFTMSNTVYLDNSYKVQGPVDMKNKIKTTMEDAEKDPINVHVERVAAKFSVTFNNNTGTSILTNNALLYTTDLSTNGISVKSEYNGASTPSAWGVLVNGWDVNGTETKTYWVKHLYDGSNFTTTEGNSTQYYTGEMSPTTFGKWAATTVASADEYGWNDNNRLRSYWAVDPHYNAADETTAENYPQQYRQAEDNNDIIYGSNANVNSVLHYVSYNNLSQGIDKFTYAPENTFAYANEGAGAWFKKSDNESYDYAGHDYKRTSTHILVKAQLLLGDEVTGASIPNSDDVKDKYCYENTYWSGANKAELIKYMVAAVIGYGSFDLYTSATNHNDNNRFDAKDANQYFDLDQPANIEGGDGRVKLTLKTDNSLYYADGTAVTDNDKDFKRAVQVVGTAKHYNKGQMYYYIPIKHMAHIDDTTPDADGNKVNNYKVGSYGVVRNHWYKVNVNSIKSPGIPVDKPDDPIIPNDDPDEGAYASFEIVIIPWHVITQDVPLE